MKEYTIWGKVAGDPWEQLLLTAGRDGKPITDPATAKELADWCTAKGAKSVRVQVYDGSPPDFVAALNIGRRRRK